jgi:Ser/Thr protein kinase RdoA (MazF antagonist)
MPENAHWTAILADTHGITADLEPLDGEYGLNFRVVTGGAPTHVLKIMRPGCDPALVDLQCAALAHLENTTPGLPLPRVVPTVSRACFG